MALLNTMNPQDAGRRLGRWLATKVPAAAATVSDVQIPQSAGFSMTTLLFRVPAPATSDSTSLDLVARVAPRKPGLFERPDLEREFKLLSALADSTDIRVPRVRWLEQDASWLGAPFLVMDRAFGQVPPDDPPYPLEGWILELAPANRAKLYDGTLREMAELHAVDWAALGLGFLGEPALGAVGAERQMAQLERDYAWVHGGDSSPTIDAAFEVLGQELPASEDLVLNWGDARIGNVVFDPGTLEVQALLDWEMATIASPEMDLGWFLFFVRYYTEGIGAERLPGFQTREELVARYEELTGRTLRHIDFYERLAALRSSILMLRVGRLMIAAGALPADSAMPQNNPASQLLARLLELPAPTGQAASFVGNR